MIRCFRIRYIIKVFPEIYQYVFATCHNSNFINTMSKTPSKKFKKKDLIKYL